MDDEPTIQAWRLQVGDQFRTGVRTWHTINWLAQAGVCVHFTCDCHPGVTWQETWDAMVPALHLVPVEYDPEPF